MKLLVIRMSSLGDVLLSLAFLENLPADTKVDWIISSSFAFVLKGHPRIRNLIIFDKKEGIQGWLKLLKLTTNENYDARVDLHVTLRTKIARAYLLFHDLLKFQFTPWRSISKERTKTLVYLMLKRLCPKAWRPVPLWRRVARVGATLSANKMSMLKPPVYTQTASSEKYGLKPKQYFCIAPASRWKTKEWDARHYALLCHHLVKNKEASVIILGRITDAACIKMVELLTIYKTPFFQALEETDFGVTADLLKNAIAYIGGDTGLAHLSEAVGTPVVMIFGPTRPELGFGPWREKSVAVNSDVFCSPCSKDGRICFRITDPYACLSRISVDSVLVQVKKVWLS